jgi:PAS domain S-box-containing protein
VTPNDDTKTLDPAALRRRAEDKLKAGDAGSGSVPDSNDPTRLIHELQVHQIELELQNEELRQSRDIVEQQRALYRDLYDNAPNGYVTLSRDGTVSVSNRTAATLLGREVSALTGKRFGAFVAEADRGRLNTFLEQLFDTGGTDACELTLAENSGDARHVVLDGVRSKDGTECRVSVTDVTQRRRAEAALRLRDREVRAVSQGVLITDPKSPGNPIIYANPAFERMTGYTAVEVAGRNCRFLQGKDTDAAAVSLIRVAIEKEQPCEVELLNYRKDGTPFWNALYLTPVRDDKGAIIQFIGVLRDVTERRELEQSLRQAQRMEAVGRLAGGIAHDFNKLLTVINGYSGVLQADLSAEDPNRAIVRQIGEAGEQAATLTHQLLAFSRSQSIDPTVLDLNDVVGNLDRLLRQMVGTSISVHTELDPTPAHVRVDAAQIGQVIVNLVVFGRDAMPKGGTLTVRTAIIKLDSAKRVGHEDLPAGSYVRLTITDTGTGMDVKSVARAFESGFVPETGASSGLGLSMVYGLVKQCQGFLAVDSVPGRGTTFSLHLPIFQQS